jgi:hypothetical protein
MLLKKALECWDNKLMYSNYAPNSKALYDKSRKFNRLAIITGYRLYHRFCLADLLLHRHPVFRATNKLIKFWDKVLNLFFDARYSPSNQKPPHLAFKEAKLNEPGISEIIPKYMESNPFKRGIKEFDTIFTYPWVTEINEEDDSDKKYHFSTGAKQFFYKKIVLYNADNQPDAFFIVKIRDSVLKVPYLFCDEKHKTEIAQIIKYYIKKYKINYSVIFDEALATQIIKEKVPLIFKKPTYKDFFAAKEISDKLINTKLKVYDGDGDGVFT